MQRDLVLYNKETNEIIAIITNGNVEARMVIQQDYRLIELPSNIDYIEEVGDGTIKLNKSVLKNNIVFLDDYRQRG